MIATLALAASLAAAQAPKEIGVVLMHGKGGSPSKHVSRLASELKGKGFLVDNREMPWSKDREYDVTVSSAEAEVEAALSALRAQGARKVFVAGHSQGGLFALHFGGQHRPDGVIAIVPGGHTGSPMFREKLGPDFEKAQKLLADGKGDKKTGLDDYEGSKGKYLIRTTPAIYVGWFDPDGAMNLVRAAGSVRPDVPVLYVTAKDDYAALQKVAAATRAALPRNPLTEVWEAPSDHLSAPSAAAEEIARWILSVAAAK